MEFAAAVEAEVRPDRFSACPEMSAPALSPAQTIAPTILIFDSGLGGLTVFREVLRARGDARFIYAADDALFPYGALSEPRLIERVTEVIGALIEQHRPDVIVIACNTASTIVMPTLRQRFATPFVGTVPAIKPACAASQSKRVSVLGTVGTVQREYTRELIRRFAKGCAVTLVGAPNLAEMAEAELHGAPAADAAIRAEIAPCFVDDGARTDTIVLGCTHYPLLHDRLTALAPWPVCWIDPAPAIARRVVELIGPAAGAGEAAAQGEIVFTSGRVPPPRLAETLNDWRLGSTPHTGSPVLRDACLRDAPQDEG